MKLVFLASDMKLVYYETIFQDAYKEHVPLYILAEYSYVAMSQFFINTSRNSLCRISLLEDYHLHATAQSQGADGHEPSA
jgi:hypothetical protein